MIADFWFWWLPVLAAVQPGISPGAVGTILGGVLVALVGGGILGKKVEASRKVTIDPQPLEIDLKERFVTRREFEKHELRVEVSLGEIKGILNGTSAKMEALFERTMDTIEKRDKSTAAKLDSISTGAYRGRQKLWEQTNASREDVAGLKATSDVANQIGKLAEAIQPKTPTKRGTQS